MKWVCSVCGYVHEGDTPPEKCPQCGVGAEKFTASTGEISWADQHVVGVAKGVDETIVNDLRDHFMGECTEVGMYLAMARVAHREGYPEVGLYYEKAAWEEAEHAAKFASEKLLQIQQRRTLSSELRQKQVLAKLRKISQLVLSSRILTLFTTQFTKWLRMKQDTEQLSRVS